MRKSAILKAVQGVDESQLPPAMYYATFDGDPSFIKAIRQIISVAAVVQGQQEQLREELFKPVKKGASVKTTTAVNANRLANQFTVAGHGETVQVNAQRLDGAQVTNTFMMSAMPPHAPTLTYITKWLDKCEEKETFWVKNDRSLRTGFTSKTLKLGGKTDLFDTDLGYSNMSSGAALKYRKGYDEWAQRVFGVDTTNDPVSLIAAIAYESYLFKSIRSARMSAQTAKRNAKGGAGDIGTVLAKKLAVMFDHIVTGGDIGTVLWRICLLRRTMGQNVTALVSSEALSQIAVAHRNRIISRALGGAGIVDAAASVIKDKSAETKTRLKMVEQFAITKFYDYDPGTGILHNTEIDRPAAPSAMTLPNPTDDRFVSTKRAVMFCIFEAAGLSAEEAAWYIPRQFDESLYGTYAYWKADNFWFRAKGGVPDAIRIKVGASSVNTSGERDD